MARSLASVPWRWEVEVILELPLAATAARIPPTLAELVDAGEGGRDGVADARDSLDWMASVLAGLGCDFTVVQPAELCESVAALAGRLAGQVRRRASPRSRCELLTKTQQRAHLPGVP